MLLALSMFFAIHDEVYAGDNASVLLNENGYELLCDYLNSHPKNLKDMLLKTCPKNFTIDLRLQVLDGLKGLRHRRRIEAKRGRICERKSSH